MNTPQSQISLQPASVLKMLHTEDWNSVVGYADCWLIYKDVWRHAACSRFVMFLFALLTDVVFDQCWCTNDNAGCVHLVCRAPGSIDLLNGPLW